MRNDDDGVLLLQIHGKLLDFGGRDGVERTRRLVHQQNLRLHGQRPRDAKPLLLPAGKAQRALFQPVFDLVPDRRAAQRLLDDLVQLILFAHAVRPGAVGNVVVDAHGKGIRLLEDHADLAPQLIYVHGRREDILPVIFDLTLNAHTRNQIVHTVERLEKR